MKKTLAGLLAALMLLTGCAGGTGAQTPTASGPAQTEAPAAAGEQRFSGTMVLQEDPVPYVSRFGAETRILLSDDGITVDGGPETGAVFTSRDIIYYEDKTHYDSGNPYGEGTGADTHTAQEAQNHTVVNITAPGAYRISGTLSAGQIRIDLGADAYHDPDAVVELILEDARISCTVAPAILFLNVYECDGSWSAETASALVDTSAAGANLILEGHSTVSGSYVAKIFRDQEEEKKLWKQDGAIYSYMSMNVFGPGSLDLTAANEGLDTELHLTVNGGSISIRAGNDGINTNEDGVSVTTVNGGCLHIIAGLGAEGDGIDSNGYLVINGGTVVASANPGADAGMDADLGSFIHGGTVIALGSTMDWAESSSGQATMNLQFSGYRDSGSAVVVARQDGTVVFAYDPSEDEILQQDARQYMGAVISCPGFAQGESYRVYLDGVLSGTETGGVYTQVTDYRDGVQMYYTGTRLGPGMGGMMPPDGFREGEGRPVGQEREMPARPEGESPTWPEGEAPTWPEGEAPTWSEGEAPTWPEGEAPTWPEGEAPTWPEGEAPTWPEGEPPRDGFGDRDSGAAAGQLTGEFFLADTVNAFSGVSAAP